MIEIEDLHHHYEDGTHALKGINLAIPQGEFLLICGPNGSGKTTLIRLIGGLMKPTAGSVRLNRLEAGRAVKDIRAFVGTVFQDADSQIVGETVREDVAFGPENLGLPADQVQERVTWAMQVMGLERISEKPCYLLSGGEKKRLSIAGVLAMKPQVILFDEPFSHLDYPGTREILRHMVDLHRQGHTLVLTTHDVEKVIGHVDRLAVIDQGELKLIGSPDAVVPHLSRFGVRPPCSALASHGKISWLNG